jgi:hypothetical protein
VFHLTGKISLKCNAHLRKAILPMPAIPALSATAFSNRRLVFLHIPKTAGSTLWHILRRQYTPQALFRTDENALAPVLTPQQWNQTRVLLGHFAYGIKVDWREPPVYITVLRDPQERLLSHYGHAARDLKNFLKIRSLSDFEGPLTLNDYLDSRWWEIDNGQTRMLAGPEAMALPFGECGQDVFETAKRNLLENIALTGLTERFDETLLLLRRMFGWNLPCYLSENIGTSRPRREAVSLETLQRISELTRWDRELYALAETRLDEHIAEAGPSFAVSLHRFRRANVRYAWMKSLVASGPLRVMKSQLPLKRQMALETVVRRLLGRARNQ